MKTIKREGPDTKVKIPSKTLRDNYRPILNGMSTDSQNYMILKHLIEQGSISSYESFELYGITRLSARIHDLRHSFGVAVKATSITKKSAMGANVTYAVYTIGGSE